jgi:hypothetical protein
LGDDANAVIHRNRVDLGDADCRVTPGSLEHVVFENNDCGSGTAEPNDPSRYLSSTDERRYAALVTGD